jgi:hypothetical protein
VEHAFYIFTGTFFGFPWPHIHRPVMVCWKKPGPIFSVSDLTFSTLYGSVKSRKMRHQIQWNFSHFRIIYIEVHNVMVVMMDVQV